MPAKREYNVKGTNDFLILAAIFFFLCLWAVKDAWFPSEKVLKKHPLKVDVVFAVSGTVKDVKVGVGDPVGENELLAELRSDRVAVEYDKAKEAYTEAKNKHMELEKELAQGSGSAGSSDAAPDLQTRLETSQQTMDEALANVEELRNVLDSSELKAPSKGTVQKVLIAPHTMVAAEQTAFIINPKDHFYTFNKSLTVFSFILFWVFLAVHILAR